MSQKFSFDNQDEELSPKQQIEVFHSIENDIGQSITEKSKVASWINDRLPIVATLENTLKKHPYPKNLSYWWNFGSLAGIALVLQILTGLFLAMHYVPNTKYAFDSVEHIMRDVNYGWLIRYIHAVGASMFFVALYAHIIRALFYGSYKAPREVLWWIGIIIFLLTMATAFMGYVLPWGQMSFWGATVITNLFSAIPVVGQSIVQWLWGGYSVDNPTLNRFFVLHFLMPFLIVGIVFLHLMALHTVGSNNPSGVPMKTKKDSIPFHPYFTIKDMVGFVAFFIVFGYFLFFYPNALGHPDNYIPANPLVTPPHIVPEWYFLPFYAILRAVPDKLGGVVMMFGAIILLFFIPYLDRSKIRSGAYRPTFQKFFYVFVVNFIFLGWLGKSPAEGWYIWASRIATFYYYAYFLIILPNLPKFEKILPLPSSIDEHYQQSHKHK
ncbi:MAG: cytochrome bc complex cytochrome b subunit [Alphaproteobacteria bacterium]